MSAAAKITPFATQLDSGIDPNQLQHLQCQRVVASRRGLNSSGRVVKRCLVIIRTRHGRQRPLLLGLPAGVLIAAKPLPHFWSEIGKFGQLLRQLINLVKLIRPLASPKDHPAVIVADSLPAVDYLHEVGSERLMPADNDFMGRVASGNLVAAHDYSSPEPARSLKISASRT